MDRNKKNKLKYFNLGVLKKLVFNLVEDKLFTIHKLFATKIFY